MTIAQYPALDPSNRTEQLSRICNLILSLNVLTSCVLEYLAVPPECRPHNGVIGKQFETFLLLDVDVGGAELVTEVDRSLEYTVAQ